MIIVMANHTVNPPSSVMADILHALHCCGSAGWLYKQDQDAFHTQGMYVRL